MANGLSDRDRAIERGAGLDCGGVKERQNMIINEAWSLTIGDSGKIAGKVWVEHRAFPKFIVQIVVHAGQPNPHVSFVGAKWTDTKPADVNEEMEWYFKALEFYNKSKKA